MPRWRCRGDGTQVAWRRGDAHFEHSTVYRSTGRALESGLDISLSDEILFTYSLSLGPPLLTGDEVSLFYQTSEQELAVKSFAEGGVESSHDSLALSGPLNDLVYTEIDGKPVLSV